MVLFASHIRRNLFSHPSSKYFRDYIWIWIRGIILKIDRINFRSVSSRAYGVLARTYIYTHTQGICELTVAWNRRWTFEVTLETHNQNIFSFFIQKISFACFCEIYLDVLDQNYFILIKINYNERKYWLILSRFMILNRLRVIWITNYSTAKYINYCM